LGADTTVYSTANEITNTTGTAYTAGGKPLTVTSTFPKTSGTTAIVDFDNISWTDASFTARGALIYNSTFEIQFPVADATSAIIRIA
jgi:hypothetical protein